MSRISVSVAILVVFSLLTAIAALAGVPPIQNGGPPQLWVGIPTGQTAPWGQERIESAACVVGEQFEVPFADGWFPYDGSVTYAAIESVPGGLPLSAKSGVPVMGQLWWVGYIWSGLGESRSQFQTTFSIGDVDWEYRWELEVYRPTDELNEPWTAVTMSHGDHLYLNMDTIKVSNLDDWRDGYMFRVYATPVPEPGSMLAMFTGLIGLVGFGIRRRK